MCYVRTGTPAPNVNIDLTASVPDVVVVRTKYIPRVDSVPGDPLDPFALTTSSRLSERLYSVLWGR